jgi:orotidine-5'-phosphate decarboxylase
MELTPEESFAKVRVCLALDGINSVSAALYMAEELREYVGMFKVGKELHTLAGNEGVNIVEELYKRDMSTFLDLKFHDTPQTVSNASVVSAVPGVYMFNVHVAGGEEMCKKAVEAVKVFGVERPKVIGVTVLTSLNDDNLKADGYKLSFDDLVNIRTENARNWGLDGIVCPANKAGELEKRFGGGFMYVTPGITYGGKQGAGQKQLCSPEQAVRECKNSILVIGSAITKAENKVQTAYDILKSMAPYI